MASISPKRVLILGATGGTGREVVRQALTLHHDVSVFVRRPEALPVGIRADRIFTGSLPDNPDALAAAMAGQDAVISALGRGLKLRAERLMERCIPIILGAMERQGVRRLIFTSAYGVGETWRDVPFVGRIIARTFLRDLYADKARGEELLRRSALDWTLVYPTQLTNRPGSRRYRSGDRLALRGLPSIPRADLAHFLVTQLDDTRFIRRGVLVSA